MKLSTTLAFSALLALSSAIPLEKRRDITTTTTIEVVETIDVVVTVFVPPGGKPADQDVHQQVAQLNVPNPAPVVHITPVKDVATPAQTSAPVAQQGSPEAAQNQINQDQDQKNQAQAAKNQAAQEQSIQAQSQANQAQDKANENKVAQNQAASAPVSAPPADSVNVPAVPPPAKAVNAPAVPPATQDSASSDQTQPTTGGSCHDAGGPCTATNVTFFDGGLGACGWTNDTKQEDFFALAHEMMGEQSNGNPFCGRTAAITYQGKTAHGTLTDKCMGCGLQSIDLSHHLFDQLFVEDVGNYHEIEWHFTS